MSKPNDLDMTPEEKEEWKKEVQETWNWWGKHRASPDERKADRQGEQAARQRYTDAVRDKEASSPHVYDDEWES